MPLVNRASTKFTLSLIACVLACSTRALGGPVLIDFSPGFGTPPGNWNVIRAQATDVPLVDFDTGGPSGATLSTSNLDVYLQNHQSWSAGGVDWVSDPVADDMLGTHAVAQAVFKGLDGPAYRLELVSAFFRDTLGGVYTAQGRAPDTTYTGMPAGSPWLGHTDGRENWMAWEAITPARGEIVIDVVTTATIPAMGGVRLTNVVADPFSAAPMVGAGLLSIWPHQVA